MKVFPPGEPRMRAGGEGRPRDWNHGSASPAFREEGRHGDRRRRDGAIADRQAVRRAALGASVNTFA